MSVLAKEYGNMDKIDCPKCLSPNAYHQRTLNDVVLRCLCGYYKVVATTLETITIEHSEVGGEVKLPKKDTNLFATLAALAVSKQATSAELTTDLVAAGRKFSVSDVASYLTILRSKGLVWTVLNRRGVAGGSTWAVSEQCRDLLGL